MFCSKCGKQIEDNIKFCPYCGNKIASFSLNNITDSIKKAADTAVNTAISAGNAVKDNESIKGTFKKATDTATNLAQSTKNTTKDSYDFLDTDEQIIMEGPANKQQFMGINKGGTLVLTNKRIVFLAHALNLGSQFDEIPFSQVAFSGNTLNIFCPTPNMIKVVTRDGNTNQFVVSGKQKNEWKEKIAECVKNYKIQ